MPTSSLLPPRIWFGVTAIEHSKGGSTIREAVQADLLDVYRIEKLVFEQPWPFSAFEQYVGEPGFLVREHPAQAAGLEENSLAGYVVADAIPNHTRPLGHVKDIAVHPSTQGQGVGRSLLARALDVLSEQGVRSAKLEVRRSNEAALGLYRDFGFEVLRTLPRYYADGEDAFIRDRDAF